jgi:hypothetical protein
MSDTPQSIPLLDYLRNRERELGQVIDDATARRKEVRDLVKSLEDGRTSIGRKLKEAPVPVDGQGVPFYKGVTVHNPEPPDAA